MEERKEDRIGYVHVTQGYGVREGSQGDRKGLGGEDFDEVKGSGGRVGRKERVP